jgi:hypothetical protein
MTRTMPLFAKRPRAKIVPASHAAAHVEKVAIPEADSPVDLEESSAAKRLRVPVYRSAPSFSAGDCTLVGTRAEVMSTLKIQQHWRVHYHWLCARRVHATLSVQLAWRRTVARREGIKRIVLHKSQAQQRLGLTFSQVYTSHALLAKVVSGGQAHAAGLCIGDRIVRVNGEPAAVPAVVARLLRETVGRIELQLVPAARVDQDSIARAEWAAERAHAAASIACSAAGDAEDDECAVCMSLLCEPVRWAGGARAAASTSSADRACAPGHAEPPTRALHWPAPSAVRRQRIAQSRAGCRSTRPLQSSSRSATRESMLRRLRCTVGARCSESGRCSG